MEPRVHTSETSRVNDKPHAVLALQESRQSPPQERAPVSCEEPTTTPGQRKKPESTGERVRMRV